MPSCSTISTPRNCVSSPMRAPLYAAIHLSNSDHSVRLGSASPSPFFGNRAAYPPLPSVPCNSFSHVLEDFGMLLLPKIEYPVQQMGLSHVQLPDGGYIAPLMHARR